MSFFITGIGTEVGKTVCSALLCRVLDADYWKPVQAGDLQSSDSNKVQQWAGLTDQQVHPEAFRLTTPASPHFAAAVDGVTIEVKNFISPDTSNTLITEGAGGLFVPFNDTETTLDLIEHFGFPVILVARNYLGSINHTLLSIAALRQRKLPLAGLLYSGSNYRDNIEIITQHSGIAPLAQLPELTEITPQVITQWATELGPELKAKLHGKEH
ncbi:MAG: dethiobiotin synthase [Bacteroidota bacterium]